jgi:phosphoserine phosphatase RsbU/P
MSAAPDPSSCADHRAVAVSAAQMQLVLDVSRMLAVTTDLDALLLRIAESTCQLVHCERASIWLHDDDASQLWTKVALGSGEIRVPDTAGIVGATYTANDVLHIPHPYDDPRFNPANDKRTGFVTRSLLAAPMEDSGGKPIGVIQAVNKLGPCFIPEDLTLIRLLADQAGVAIQRHRLQVAALQAAELRKEMDLARKVQEALLPKTIPEIPGFDAAGWAKPASITGGDCYDFWQLPDGRLGIFLGDASGHGLAPTLVVSQARTLVRALCDSTNGLCTPHEILTRINARLSEDLEESRFITAFLAFLSPDGTLHWQSAGHGPIFYRPRAGAPVQSLEAPVPPLNALPTLLDDSPLPLQIEPGGALVVMSDGIFESFSPTDEQFGTDRVIELLDQSNCHPAQHCIDSLHDAVAKWQEKDEPNDDQTIVIVKRAHNAPV